MVIFHNPSLLQNGQDVLMDVNQSSSLGDLATLTEFFGEREWLGEVEPNLGTGEPVEAGREPSRNQWYAGNIMDILLGKSWKICALEKVGMVRSCWIETIY